jgi:predicted small secreted protein
LFRCPDEAYIIEYTNGVKVIKILEKKEQNVEGSVETKLWSGPSLKREYELVLGNGFTVVYGFCVSKFLKDKIIVSDKKFTILNTIFNENNIEVLFGDDENYFETLDKWVNNLL